MDNDDLFALRLYYQDHYNDENKIIKKLKEHLKEFDLTNNEINTKLQNFYSFYGINIKLEDLDNINTEPNIFINNISNLMNIINNNNEEDTENEDTTEDENTTKDDNITENDNITEDDDTTENDDTTEDDDNTEYETEEDISTEENEYNEINYIPIPTEINGLNNIINSLENLTFGSISIINYNLDDYDLNDYDDNNIICTLDDEENSKLNKNILEKDINIECSICLCNLCATNEIIELPCKHIYHENCIMTWLSKYNYKCPSCREEVGKPKYNI